MDIREWVVKLIVIPIIAVVGIYIAGVFIEELFGIPEAGKILFWAVGGIAFFGFYFRSVLSK